jgi:hypothetical protein
MSFEDTTDEGLHNFYTSPNIISDKVKEDKMVRACSTYREGRSAYRVFTGNPGRRKALGRPRLRL